MTKEQVISIFKEKPYLLNMGANKIASQIKADVNTVRIARSIIRNNNIPKEWTSNNVVVNKETYSGRTPKILIMDIETAPLKVYVWSRWKQNVSLSQTISEWFMLCWSAKWLYSSETFSDVLTPSEVASEDDSRICRGLWDLLNEADVVVAHNGNSFDIPKINSRFISNGMHPPKPFHSIDTKVIAAKQFGFSSNKLDALAMYFGFDVKLKTDFELWVQCMHGNEDALKYMQIYNVKDVRILEEVYLRLRPWIKNHPNLGVYLESDSHVCGNCGSEDLTYIDSYYTNTGKYAIYRCKCGAMSRVRKNSIDKNKLKVLLTNTLR